MDRDMNALRDQILAKTKALLGYWDKNMICRFANEAYTDWLGIKPEDIIDKVTLQEFLGSFYDKHLPRIKEVLAGKPQVFERDFVLPSGRSRRAIVTYTPDLVGKSVEGFYVHAADISPYNDTLNDNIFKSRDHVQETIKTLQMNILSRFPGIEQLAKNEGISAFKLKGDFYSKTGSNLFAYYRTLQMHFAHSYLSENRCSRKQMAAILNFANPSNFSVCYNKYLKERELSRPNNDQNLMNEDHYKVFIQQAPVAMAMLDNDLRILAASEKWMDSDPLKQRDIFGKYIFDLYQDLNPQWISIVKKALKGKHYSSSKDYLLSYQKMRYIKWDIKPWYKQAKQVGGLIVYIEDITELVQAS